MPKTKSFRVATSGATIDGRTIDPQTLQDMAATYDPKTYQARVNLEHYMSMSPDSTFSAYGDVLALRTEPVTLNVGGKDEQRLGLYAEIDAHDSLVALKDKKQKLFTSIEVTPNFAGTGKAYLSGLAFTDSPAALGTEAMKFRSAVSDASPFHFTETQKNALFTPPIETTFEFAETTPVGTPGKDPDAQANGIMDALLRALRGYSAKPDAAPPVAPPAAANTPDPQAVAAFAAIHDSMGKFAMLITENTARVEQIASEFAAFRSDSSAMRTELTAATTELGTLRGALAKTPGAQFTTRPASTGGGGDQALKTDC